MSNSDQLSYRVAYRTEGGWGRPNREQTVVLLVSVVATMTALIIGGFIAAVISAFIGLALYAPVYGKPLRYPGINAIELALERRRIRRRGGNIFSRDLKDSILQFDEDTHTLRTLAKPKERSVRMLSFQPARQNDRLAFFRRTDKHCDDLIAVLITDGAPGLVWAEQADRFVGDQRIVRAFKRAVGTTTKPLSFSQFVVHRAADPTGPVVYAENRWHPDFRGAEAGTAEAGVVGQALDEDDMMYGEGSRYILGVAFRMDFPEQWRKKDLNELSQDIVRSADIMKVVETFRKSLSGAATRLRLPNLFELNELGYLLFNTEDLVPFYAQNRKDIEADQAGKLETVDDAITLRQGPFPAHLSVHHDHLLANRTYHGTLMVTDSERGDYAPGFLDSLFQSPYSYAYSQVVHTLDYAKSVKKAKRKRLGLSFISGFLSTLTGKSADPDYDLAAEENESDARDAQRSLFYSRSRAILSRIQLTVSSGSCSDTQGLVNSMQAEMKSHGLGSVQLLGADTEHQVESVLSHLCLQERM